MRGAFRVQLAVASVLVCLHIGAKAADRPDVVPAYLRCEYQVDPEAIDAQHPRLSWILASRVRGARQSAYRIVVAAAPGRAAAGVGDMWDSGVVRSAETAQVAYRGRALRSRQQAWWRVRVWDARGRPSGWSRVATFTMGLLSRKNWQAKWISCAMPLGPGDDTTYRPSPMLRREFAVAGRVRRAVLYATAAGVYEMYVNGRPVSRDVLRPGWTEYGVRLYYQAYDVTRLVRRGANAIGAVLGDGWYGLHHGGRGNLRLLAELHIELTDGRAVVVPTDTRWRGTIRGPIRMSDIYNGEAYDARLAMGGWALPGYRAAGWLPVKTGRTVFAPRIVDVTSRVSAAVRDGALAIDATNENFTDPAYGLIKYLRVAYRHGAGPVRHASALERTPLRIASDGQPLTIVRAEYGAWTAGSSIEGSMLQAHPGPPVQRTGVLRPVRLFEPTPGVFVYDLGQNFAGWARLRVQGPPGVRVQLRFAEMLNPDGTIYTTNLRDAKCTDTYILRGRGAEVWEPRFTFHGFRYVEVTGYPGRPDHRAITGIVLNSAAPLTSSWQSSDRMLNRLFQNIVWGQRSNYLEVPTDCPQRNERMGWTGDAQAFIGTAVYNMDIAAFMTAWLRTLNDGQTPEGGYPNFAPRGGGVSPAWGDAGLICPMECLQTYGDRRVLLEHWPRMKRWISYLEQRSSALVRPAEGFGDWVNLDDNTPADVISTAYFAHGAHLMSEMARAIGRPDDARRYAALFGRVRVAFQRAFVGPEVRVKSNSQTAYLLALAFDLLPPQDRPRAFAHLLERLQAREWHLSTGFLGVNLLLPVLTENGRPDLAWRLLTTKSYPSWLYSVSQGATTIWERWDGWRHDKGFQDPGMNSFNHYTFGSCGRWMMSTAAGIASDGEAYRRITIRPVPGGGLTWVKAHYDSIRGRIATEWRIRARAFSLSATVPANTEATVWVPAASARSVIEGGVAADRAHGVRYLGYADGAAAYRVGGGTYRFRSVLAR